MKKLVLTLTALGLAACSSKGVNLYDSDPKDALTAAVNGNLKAEWNIKEIRFDQAPEEAPFTDVMGRATVRVIADDEKETSYDISLVDKSVKEAVDHGAEARARVREAQAKAGVKGPFARGEYGKVADLDYSKIRANLAAGGELVKKEGFDNAGTDHYEIELNQDKSKVKHSFTLNAKGKDATSVQGRRIVTNYVQIDFEADAAGNVKMLDPK